MINCCRFMVLAVVFVLGCAACAAPILKPATPGPAQVAETFMNDIWYGRYEQAFEAVSTAKQAEQSREQFVTGLEKAVGPDGIVGSINESFTFSDSETVSLLVRLRAAFLQAFLERIEITADNEKINGERAEVHLVLAMPSVDRFTPEQEAAISREIGELVDAALRSPPNDEDLRRQTQAIVNTMPLATFEGQVILIMEGGAWKVGDFTEPATSQEEN